MRHFADRLAAAIADHGTPAVVGLDPVLERLPADLQPVEPTAEAAARAVEAFTREVIDRVAPRVPAVKINSGFFEVFHEHGVGAYYRLISYAHARGLLVIGDIKRGDIGSTAKLYARGHLATPTFDDLGPERMPDAVTLAGYLGRNAIAPFVEAARESGRGLYILARPSDPGADEVHEFGGDAPFYRFIGQLIREWGDDATLIGDAGLSCVGAVVAPKDPQSTAALRAELPRTPLLVPGYGAQGASAEACRACFTADGRGAVVNASRSVIYAFEKAEYRARHGADWAACIADAARDFAADLARVVNNA